MSDMQTGSTALPADQQLDLVRSRHVQLMEKTLALLQNVLQGVHRTTATTLRDPDDGAKGWTVLEVLCHLRDYDEIFYNRAVQMRTHDYPTLSSHDHEALAVERNYNGQELDRALADLQRSRQRFMAFFNQLSPAEWERAGVHPARGHFTMTDAVMQVGLHDITHIEQITRILRAYP